MDCGIYSLTLQPFFEESVTSVLSQGCGIPARNSVGECQKIPILCGFLHVTSGLSHGCLKRQEKE